MTSRPQPHSDFEIAKICAWLKLNGYTMHVTLRGDVTLRKKTDNGNDQKGHTDAGRPVVEASSPVRQAAILET